MVAVKSCTFTQLSTQHTQLKGSNFCEAEIADTYVGILATLYYARIPAHIQKERWSGAC